MRTEGTRIIALTLGITAFGCDVEDSLPDPSEEARRRREAYEDQLEDIRNQQDPEREGEGTDGPEGDEPDSGAQDVLPETGPSASTDAGVTWDAQTSMKDDAAVEQEPDDASLEPGGDASVEQAPEDASIEEDAETDADESDAAQDADEPSVSFARVYEILEGPCSGCHGAGKKLDFSTATMAYAELVDAAAEYGSCFETGAVIVVPYDAAASLLIQKLENTQPCGVAMPIGAPALDQALIDEIRSWIDDGAPSP